MTDDRELHIVPWRQLTHASSIILSRHLCLYARVGSIHTHTLSLSRHTHVRTHSPSCRWRTRRHRYEILLFSGLLCLQRAHRIEGRAAPTWAWHWRRCCRHRCRRHARLGWRLPPRFADCLPASLPSAPPPRAYPPGRLRVTPAVSHSHNTCTHILTQA
jgi:hypothetical protein